MASPIHRTSTLDLDQIEKLEQQALDTGNLALHEACRRVRRTLASKKHDNAVYLLQINHKVN